MPDEPLLSVRGAAVERGGVRLLGGVDLALAAGELVAVTGPSGIGKTTLLRALAGLIDAAAGAVALAGAAPDAMGWPEYRRRVVLVDQQPVMLAGSVRDNLARPFSYLSAGGAPFPESRARELLSELAVGDERLDQPADSLSVGQQQRVALIRALLLSPAVLLLDEPTSALDREAAAAVEAYVQRSAAADGLAALIVLHDLGQAERWCSRRVDLAGFVPGIGAATHA